ncbi:MAG: hypothetical protein ACR2NR_02055 [Solirubrobacteraceae bacterium]
METPDLEAVMDAFAPDALFHSPLTEKARGLAGARARSALRSSPA